MTRADRDNTCFFRTKTGETCGVKSGKKRKCTTHRGLRCDVCGKPAWKDCPVGKCPGVLCRNPACWSTHAELHGGEGAESTKASPVDAGPEHLPDAELCPACADSTVPRYVLPSQRGSGGRMQVQCSGCGICGPLARTVKLAVAGGDRMPRGRPAVYEGIRRRGLEIIEGALRGYAEMDPATLAAEDCEAVARMLESATMAVDTWEL